MTREELDDLDLVNDDDLQSLMAAEPLHVIHPLDGPLDSLPRRRDNSLEPLNSSIIAILLHAPELAGKIAFNLMSNQVEVRGEMPYQRFDHLGPRWSDFDDTSLMSWLETGRYRLKTGIEKVPPCVDVAAKHQAFHPVRTYLSGLKWDNVERLTHWLADVFGCPNTPYEQAVGRATLIGAVARVMNPGAQMDTVLILEGKQGLHKSQCVKALLPDPEWFTDARLDTADWKRAVETLQGHWIVELAELGAITRGELEAVKAFITTQRDDYRPAFARRNISRPRQCVFFGTINPGAVGYLRDDENRRFWPIRVLRDADPEQVRKMRDQLWAEAMTYYQLGYNWYLDADVEELARKEQNERRMSDAMQDIVEEWLQGRQVVTFVELMEGPFQCRPPYTPSLQMQAGRVMKEAGWMITRYRDPASGRRYRAYVPVEP